MKPDTIDDLKESDLVQISRQLLEAVIRSTAVMKLEKMTPEKLKECRTVLGFLNAANNTLKTKLNIFRLTGMTDKLKFMKEHSKSL